MKRVVGPFGIQADFNIVFRAASLPEDFLHHVAEVSFDFKDEPAWFRIGICRPISQQLVRERIHATTRFAAAHSADDDGAGKEAPFRDDEPTGFLCGDRKARIVNLAQNQTQPGSRSYKRIRWQRLRLSSPARPQY